ncbi:MAG: ATP-binding cassette domain-containing protein [Actinobacteria bacterium]|nr:MAG: ATP-binding cassette domain-containing protein [Actinomycetota bacterium]REK37378.1 MAG: ATP-binding cassette domain-containing protein [Actinomycetota bacterium]
MGNETTLECRGIRRAYQTDQDLVWALWDVDTTARSGEMTVLAGPSGSGKSTLLRVMAGIDKPDHGSVEIAGTNIVGLSARARRRFRKKHIGFVFQDPAANLLGYMTVLEHLELAARMRRAEVDESLLDHLEIGELAGEHPAHLSAGQQQRVALAAAVTGDPDVVLADEPTAELDTQSASLAVEALTRLRDLGATLVVTSHDPEVVDVANKVIRIEHGAIKE